ncbi:hypothetical protein AKO1_007207 [Acrasis kona]|uniref:Uncharacterized protein n=1 Tax=Acrasis kona TaxID=1008807 RepID=A0AAW2YVC5_9EUKA
MNTIYAALVIVLILVPISIYAYSRRRKSNKIVEDAALEEVISPHDKSENLNEEKIKISDFAKGLIDLQQKKQAEIGPNFARGLLNLQRDQSPLKKADQNSQKNK